MFINLSAYSMPAPCSTLALCMRARLPEGCAGSILGVNGRTNSASAVYSFIFFAINSTVNSTMILLLIPSLIPAIDPAVDPPYDRMLKRAIREVVGRAVRRAVGRAILWGLSGGEGWWERALVEVLLRTLSGRSYCGLVEELAEELAEELTEMLV